MPQTAIEEVVLALTEACANVVDHVHDQEAYQVDVSIDEELCRISVFDHGVGFDPEGVQVDGQPTDAERGRGLVLMRALVDGLQFVQDDDGRHRVTFEKRLTTQQPHLRLLST